MWEVGRLGRGEDGGGLNPEQRGVTREKGITTTRNWGLFKAATLLEYLLAILGHGS